MVSFIMDILLILDTCRGVSGRNNGLAMSEREYKITTVRVTSDMFQRPNVLYLYRLSVDKTFEVLHANKEKFYFM